MLHRKVLVLTKRLQDMCATQTLLYSAGFQMVTATNLDAARSVLRSVPVQAIIVCRWSWGKGERERILSELSGIRPEAALLVRCPGCTGCDDAAPGPGHLLDQVPLTELISVLSAPMGK